MRDHDGDTSYIAVVDKDRNMVSFEPSLHSGFGTGVVMGNPGFIFNCRGDYYSLVRGRGQRARARQAAAQHAAVHARDEGRPAVHDHRKSRRRRPMMRTMQTFVNIVDFGMNVQQAIEAPRWSTRSFPASPFPHTMFPGDMAVEDRIPEATQKELTARGHKLRVAPPWSLASSAAIIIDPKTGVLSAGADPRVEAYAWAW